MNYWKKWWALTGWLGTMENQNELCKCDPYHSVQLTCQVCIKTNKILGWRIGSGNPLKPTLPQRCAYGVKCTKCLHQSVPNFRAGVNLIFPIQLAGAESTDLKTIYNLKFRWINSVLQAINALPHGQTRSHSFRTTAIPLSECSIQAA